MVEVGDVIADRYELTESLGRGGMAEVFRARDRVLERDVAVKLLLGHRAEEDSFRTRFRREARAAAALSHPHVVTVHDSGADGDDLYIVMEFVDGPSLDRVIQRDGALEPERAARIASDVCRALAAAHERGFVHRDVKPANILFDASGAAKVTDFGIVRVIEVATTTDTVYGSAPFVSPEQARGDDVDGRSDLYSLGCVLYVMLTGEEPFMSDGEPLSVVYQHLHEDPPAPSSVAARVPQALDEIVARALRKAPGERYASAADMAAALDVAVSEDRRRTRRLPSATDGATVPIATAAARGGGTDGDDAGGDDPTAPDAPGRRGRRLLVALGGLGLLLATVALAATLADGPTPATSPGATPASTATTAPGSPAPTPVADEQPATEAPRFVSPQAATDRLFEILVNGEESGEATAKAVEEVRKRAEEALEKYEEGDVDKAVEKLDEARDKLAERVEKGEVTPSYAETVAASVSDVEAAMLAADVEGADEVDGDRDDDDEGKGKASDDDRGDDRGDDTGDDRGDD